MAKQIEFEQKKKLDQFQEGIKIGAKSQISRMILRLGIYQACLNNNCKRNITHDLVVQALENILKKESVIFSFYSEQRSEIIKQRESFDFASLLKPLTKNPKKAPGLLTARINKEIESIKRSLDRLDKLEKSLQIWKEGTRREQIVDSILITDLHH